MLQEDTYFQITVFVKGGWCKGSFEDFMDKKKGYREAWNQYVEEPLKRRGFEHDGNGVFVNFAGDIKDIETVKQIVEEELQGEWVRKNVKKVESAIIGPVMHMDFSSGELVRDSRHPIL